jgi:antirestriction protein ArdC
VEPINAITRTPYTGKNAMVLAAVGVGYPSSEWLTFRQALSIGRCVRKGEHGVGILKIVEGKPDPKTGKTRKGPRGYTVFNIAQTDELASQEVAS